MKKWYNDGKINKKIGDNETIPEGFVEGFLKPKTKKRKNYAEYGKIKKMYRLSQRETVLLRSLGINKKLKDIDLLSKKGYSLNDIYYKTKLDDAFQFTNDRLTQIIIEKLLIAQLETYPKFLNTITESLVKLYEKEPELQNRLSYEDYLLCSIRKDYPMP